MSSTNRSAARDLHISDYYVTPQYAIEGFINRAILVNNEKIKDTFENISNKNILDPCAGGDSRNEMSYPSVLKRIGAKSITTFDIRDDSLASKKCDYLTTDVDDSFDLIITNPPFNCAIDIIKKALNDVRDDGVVVMLLRLNFFGSLSRKKFLTENMPSYSFVHSKRMSFTDSKKTDSIEYMHAVWLKSESPKETRLVIV